MKLQRLEITPQQNTRDWLESTTKATTLNRRERHDVHRTNQTKTILPGQIKSRWRETMTTTSSK